MKQIMNLFAKERRSRKREMSKLQGQLDEKQQRLEAEKHAHAAEKR